MNAYFIHWKSTLTGQVGKGTLRFEKEKAEELCRELNFDYPSIVHEPALVNEVTKNPQSKDAEQNQSHNPPPPPDERKSVVRNKAANRRQNEKDPKY